MPTVKKTSPGTALIHNHGYVTPGETIDVDGDTAEYLVETGKYEYAESDAQSDSDTETGEDTDGDDADAEGGEALDDTVPVDNAIEQGVCAWCDDYDGESVGRHASAAHPEEWAAYKEASE